MVRRVLSLKRLWPTGYLAFPTGAGYIAFNLARLKAGNELAMSVMPMELDIVEQLQRDFPVSEIEARLSQLAQASNSLRIQRCIVFASRGHPWYFDYLCKLAKFDFRDVVMAAEYDRLNVRLYDFNRPIPEARIDDPYVEHEPQDQRSV
jgi:hypothetical protein